MPEIPKVLFAHSNIAIARLISGGNPLCGNSHFTEAMNAEMREYFTEQNVLDYMHRLEKAGINTILARGDFHRIMYWLEIFKREGGKLFWIAQTASEMADVHSNIRVIAAAGAIGIYHHGTKTDNLWLAGKIDVVKDYLKSIRDTGVQVGLGTHIPEVIKYAEEKNWDVDFYMCCLYNINRHKRESVLVSDVPVDSAEEFRKDDPDRMFKTIKQIKKMCLAFKILGAGRSCGSQEEVQTAFKRTFAAIKPADAIVVGMFPKYLDQISLNAEYAKRFAADRDAF
ncbi:MAG: hypothetical protein EHM28_00470 [Spirochaetaceae bacterium]|nr:MAG: hypothetical protein EHM28_00470 [Spirochaetaceae bacterium]